MRRTWWWIFGLLIGVPSVTLALMGLRTVRLERIERRQQVRDLQTQIARFIDSTIANALSNEETAVAYHLDADGLLIFPAHRLYFGRLGQRPAVMDHQWPAATKQWIDEAQAAEAQQRQDAT